MKLLIRPIYKSQKKLLKNLHSISNLGNYNKKIKNLFLIDGFNFWECSVFREKITYGSNNPFLHLLLPILYIS